ncbi:hypothetical protein F5Y12DRAFT_133885 [Xylaria sp. FL1777]|nr:hypothetical protein F5Y12DRAFT_133885 [Xylaria sp. FL1777]
MSDPTSVVMPARAVDSSSQERDIHPEEHDQDLKSNEEGPGHDEGPLKKVMSHSDSLYKYISWGDPVRTITSYFALLGFMYGVHYFLWTQWLLKMSAIGLGTVYLVSLISRWTTSDRVARMRPEYKRVPETMLNDTLRDIHDLVQYLAIQTQKIIYGEELGKTFGAFVCFTALFQLSKMMSPFSLGILGLSSAYILPLIASSSSRETGQYAKGHSQKPAHTTDKSTKATIHDTKVKATDLSDRAQQATGDLTSKAQKTASNVSSKAQNMGGSLSSKAQQAAVSEHIA